MQMNVEDFLARGFSIRQRQVHAFAPDRTAAQRLRQTLRHSKHLRSSIGIERGKKTGVLVRNHKHMTGIDRADVEKRRAAVVLIHAARWNLIRENFAEDAIVHLVDVLNLLVVYNSGKTTQNFFSILDVFGSDKKVDSSQP